MLNINKNNYQEYLMLYIDAELSADDAYTVEQFIETNMDAKNELELLLSTKLEPHTIAFDNIDSLLKQNTNEISLDTYTEKFSLYVDDELTNKERKQVETFVLQQPQTQADFTVFNKSKLLAPNIQHPNKKELDKTNATVFLLIKRLAAAAAIIGFVSLVWVNFSGNKNVVDDNINVATNTTVPTNIEVKKEEANTNNVVENKVEVAKTSLNNSIKLETKTNNIVKQNIVTPNYTNLVNNTTPKSAIANDNVVNNNNTINNNNLPKTLNNIIPDNSVVNNNINTSAIANNVIELNKINNSNTSNNIVKNVQSNNTAIAAVVYKNLDDDNDDDAKPKQKTKAGNLLSKAASLVNISSDDGITDKKIFSVALR